MSDLRSSGWVTCDLEPKRSQKNSLYVRFSLMELAGCGEYSHKQYFEVWAWDAVAQSLLDQKIGRGSHLWVRGYLELVDYTKEDGKSKGRKMKLRLCEWKVLPPRGRSDRPKESDGAQSQPISGPVPVVDGERAGLPE